MRECRKSRFKLKQIPQVSFDPAVSRFSQSDKPNGEIIMKYTRNSRKSFVAIAVLLALSVATVLGQTGHGYDRASLDPNASACTDFYQYANGGWMAANPIPAAYSSWGVANILDERNREMLHQILEASAKNTNAAKGSSEQKVGDYYATCMDEAKIEAEGLTPLLPEFARIAKINDQKSLQEEIAHLHS